MSYYASAHDPLVTWSLAFQHIGIHTYIHTYIHTDIQSHHQHHNDMDGTMFSAHKHTYIHTYIHTYRYTTAPSTSHVHIVTWTGSCFSMMRAYTCVHACSTTASILVFDQQSSLCVWLRTLCLCVNKVAWSLSTLRAQLSCTAISTGECLCVSV